MSDLINWQKAISALIDLYSPPTKNSEVFGDNAFSSKKFLSQFG